MSQDKVAADPTVLEALVDSSPDPIFALHPGGRLLFANAALREILGIGQADLGRVDLFEVLPARAAEAVRPMLDDIVSQPPGAARYDEIHSRVFGWFSVGAKSHAGADGRIAVIAGSIRDISKQKRQQEELEVAQRRLEASNQDLRSFASVASHDLQEPLRKIIALGDRLAQGLDAERDPQAVDHVRRILDAAGSMQVLVEDLLTMSRVSVDHTQGDAADLSAVLGAVLGNLEGAIAEAGARIEVGSLPTLAADAGQMQQVFEHLVGNALKFRRPDTAPVVRITASRQGPSWRIVVMDNGVGFDQQYAEKIFTLFQRLPGRHGDGSGIGLSVVRRIIERHQGTISASGSLGEGAVFTMTLPAG